MSTGAHGERRPSTPLTVRNANFDVMRLCAAAGVIFSHAFAITEGSERNEPLVRLLGPGNMIGVYSVFTFFIISGYLITASFLSSSLPGYILKRCLRIFPGLMLCLVVTTAIAVLYLASLDRLGGQTIVAAFGYVLKSVMLLDTSSRGLPGLVFSPNPYGKILNGSLWSIGPEFACYVVVALLGAARLLTWWMASLLLVVALGLHASALLGNMGFVLPFFMAGVLIRLRAPLFELPAKLAVGALGMVVGLIFGQPMLAFALFGSILIIRAGRSRWQLPSPTRFGDLSYGMYLYGWPIEQVVRLIGGTTVPWWVVFSVSLILAICAAAASWTFVEGPALKLARRLSVQFGQGRPISVDVDGIAVEASQAPPSRPR